MLQRTSENVMFSLKPRFIEAFLDGSKFVELRRRPPTLPVGTVVWLYGTLPFGQVMAVACIRNIAAAPVAQIWKEFSQGLGLSKGEFDRYLANKEYAAAIELDHITRVETPMGLSAMRTVEPGFQPPQFFRHIRDGALLDQLMQSQFKIEQAVSQVD